MSGGRVSGWVWVVAAGVLVVCAILAAGLVGMAFWLRSGDGSSPVASVGGGERDPTLPDVELTFGGPCHPRFTDTVEVRTDEENRITISSLADGEPSGSVLVGQGSLESLVGTHPIDNEYFQRTQVMVQITDAPGRPGFTNWMTGEGPSPLAGQLVVRSFDARTGIMDVTFDHVRLRNWNDGRICEVHGVVRTRGVRYADGRPL